MAKKLPFHGKKLLPEITLFPNDRFGGTNNFSKSPCPSKEAFSVLGMDTINKIDALLKQETAARDERCGNSVYRTGLNRAQLIRTTDNIDVYCNSSLILHDETYALPERIEKGNYTVMLTTEFVSDEVSEVMNLKRISKNFSR